MVEQSNEIEQEGTQWQPRLSTRLRIAETHPDLTAPAYIAPLKRNPLRETFINSLVAEARGTLDQLHHELASVEIEGFTPQRVEVDSSDWSINGLATHSEDGGYDLTLSLGFLLALDDVLFTTSCWDGLLAPPHLLARDDEWGLSDTIYVLGDSHDFSKRYFDYSDIKSRGVFDRKYLTYEMPANIWRQRQCQLLFDLCLRWAALHEISHAAFCHLEMIKELFVLDQQDLRLDELGLRSRRKSVSSPSLNKKTWSLMEFDPIEAEGLTFSTALQSIELHADTFGLWFGFELERQVNGANSLFDDYERDMQGLAGHMPDVMTTLDQNDRFRFLTLSAFIVIALFENARMKKRGEAQVTHPAPETRFINVMRSAFFGSHMTSSDGEGGFQIKFNVKEQPLDSPDSEWNRFMQDGLGAALMDVGVVSHELGLKLKYADDPMALDDMPSEARTREEFGEVVSGWWVDFLMLMSGQETSPEQMASQGGKELAKLFGPYALLHSASEQVQQRYRGISITFPERND